MARVSGASTLAWLRQLFSDAHCAPTRSSVSKMFLRNQVAMGRGRPCLAAARDAPPWTVLLSVFQVSSPPPLSALVAVASLYLAGPAAATGKTGQLTVFWGRNKDEGSLREACDAGLFTAVIMSFLNVYSHGKYRLDLSDHPLASIGGDIRHCQSVGVTVSLSIGGFGGDYTLPTNRSELDLADHLWFSYLGGRRRGVRRPFGRARLNGVDLFLERGGPAEHYDALARELARRKARGGKAPRLTATPRNAFPDRLAAQALPTGVFERIHVRFYDSCRAVEPACAGCRRKVGAEQGRWRARGEAEPARRSPGS
ncbi:xylanase inhibitor protein 1-like [Triticum dicoccoides]|uniref:xylanase inhibitor protein 1-like n=1 Tax=Triticum dicoccoides TaxID=85692 RepID=UPI00188E06EC|nr:xylanase inhibitor protein 1-like [Triticum dicoccoides]